MLVSVPPYSVQTTNLINFLGLICQDEQKPYHLTFIFSLVRRSGTHNGPHYEYLDAVLSLKQKLGDTENVRLGKKQLG